MGITNTYTHTGVKGDWGGGCVGVLVVVVVVQGGDRN